MISENQLLTRADTARHLNISPQTLACWASNKRYRLPYVRIGRRVMYRLKDIEEFIERNTVVQGAEQ